MKLGRLDLRLYIALLDVCGRRGAIDKLESFWQEMQKRHLKPNVLAYNVMLRCVGKNLQATRVNELLAEMKSSGLQPDEYTLTSLIEFYGRNHQIDVALRTFEDFLSQNGFKDSEHRPPQQREAVRPINAAVSVILDQCGFNNRCDAGKRIWDRVVRSGWRPTTNNFNSYIEMWARNGFYKEAESAIALMAELGVKHNAQTWTVVSSFKNRQAADLASASDQMKSSDTASK